MSCLEIDIERMLVSRLERDFPGVPVRGFLIPTVDVLKDVGMTSIVVRCRPRSLRFSGGPCGDFPCSVRLTVDLAEDATGARFADLFSRLSEFRFQLAVYPLGASTSTYRCDGVDLTGGDTDLDTGSGLWVADFDFTLHCTAYAQPNT